MQLIRPLPIHTGISYKFFDETWLKGERDRQVGPAVPLAASIAEREREVIEAALAQSRGQVSGPTGAAAKLGLPRQTLDSKIKSWESTSIGSHVDSPNPFHCFWTRLLQT
jgi:DNA-binding NtrC family response regulator